MAYLCMSELSTTLGCKGGSFPALSQECFKQPLRLAVPTCALVALELGTLCETSLRVFLDKFPRNMFTSSRHDITNYEILCKVYQGVK